jgi:hypothetical protein
VSAVAGEYRIEQTESARAFNSCIANTPLHELWNMADIRTLNRSRELSQVPPEFRSSTDLLPENQNSAQEIAAKQARLAVFFAESQKHNHKWDSDHLHGIYKCNLFLDACLRVAQVELPWTPGHVPTVQEIRRHPPHDWQPLSKNDKTSAGDVVIWDHGSYHHCGILDGKGNVIYAGSPVEAGWAKSELRLMELSPLGKPNVTFRPPYGAL